MFDWVEEIEIELEEGILNIVSTIHDAMGEVSRIKELLRR